MRSIRFGRTGMVMSGAFLGALALSGCNSFDSKPETGQMRLLIPVDDRTAVTSATPPPAISGGTLMVLADGSAAIAADPSRDTLSIVALGSLTVRNTISLQPGDEPGRSVEDAEHHVHVALRRSGAVVTIDPQSGAVLDRRAVCKAPRGIAFDALSGLLHVACAEGKLVSLDAKTGVVARSLDLDADLRDVLVRGTELWVTRFKSAEILRIAATGTPGERISVPPRLGTLAQPEKDSS